MRASALDRLHEETRGRSQGARDRVNRGGSFNDITRNAPSANRNRNDPGNRNNDLGFRPAKAPEARDRRFKDPVQA
jgi:formylglycine-generating enzyme required for sulfatase activity